VKSVEEIEIQHAWQYHIMQLGGGGVLWETKAQRVSGIATLEEFDSSDIFLTTSCTKNTVHTPTVFFTHSS
jgi:hypothetical protein